MVYLSLDEIHLLLQEGDFNLPLLDLLLKLKWALSGSLHHLVRGIADTIPSLSHDKQEIDLKQAYNQGQVPSKPRIPENLSRRRSEQ